MIDLPGLPLSNSCLLFVHLAVRYIGLKPNTILVSLISNTKMFYI